MNGDDRNPETGSRNLTRRGLFVLGLQGVFVAGLAGRMRYLQVNQAEEFLSLAEENRINIRLIPPARGLIFDRNGLPIAQNNQNYRAVIVKEDVDDLDAVLSRLQTLLKLSDKERQSAEKALKRHSPFVPIAIAENLTWQQISALSANAPALPGVTAEVGLSRFYPQGPDYAHILGYVGPVSDYDVSRIDDQDPLLMIPRFQIGKTGVETKLERTLRGAAGVKRIEVNARGRVIRELGRREGTPGRDMQLTIDSGVQNFAQARLAGESAAAVIMRVDTGDIVALASAPSFDANKFVSGISVADYAELTENKFRPLANKTVQGTYPPGSTFKMVVALAALEDGVLDGDDTVSCQGHTEVANRRFHCWKRGGHGRVDLRRALEQSCDVFFYDIAQRVGIEKISAMARKLGLGIRHDLPLSAVAQGLAPTKSWKQERQGARWVIGDTLNAGIGQGFVLSSPLQLAVMTSRIAGGRAVSPRLVRSIGGTEQRTGPAASLGISPKSLALVQQGMFDVSNGRRGTAARSRIVDEDFLMAGKTGTSQVRNITKAERASGVIRNEDLPWERRDHALFVGFAPFDDPKYAISVVVEHGGGGSKAAAPIARDIMLRALFGKVPPLSAYPASQRGTIRNRLQELDLRPLDLRPEGNIRA
jgi:penicillin-binding protein 2